MMLVYFKEMTLLSYINASFIVGGVLLFLGLVSFVFSTGFFDVFTVSMRKVVTSKRRMDDVMAMRKPSEIFSGNVSPMLGGGSPHSRCDGNRASIFLYLMCNPLAYF